MSPKVGKGGLREEEARLYQAGCLQQERRRSYVRGAKAEPCRDCKLVFPPWAMDLDHVRDKISNVSAMVQKRVPDGILRQEIAKCDPLCVLCHRLRTKARGFTAAKKRLLEEEDKECMCLIHGPDRSPGCRGCKNAHRLELYYTNRRSENARVAESKRQRRKAFLATLKSSPCVDCRREFDHSQMDFDHVRGEKVANLSRLIADNSPGLAEEIAKCDLVCAICHKFRTLARSGRATEKDKTFIKGWIASGPSSYRHAPGRTVEPAQGLI